jgi:hypothetical protein
MGARARRAHAAAVAQADRPLVLFLDDLQWADTASLEVARTLLAGGVHHVLVLGGYRDNEIGPAHPLHELYAELTRAGAAVTRLTLAPLEPAQLSTSNFRAPPFRAPVRVELPPGLYAIDATASESGPVIPGLGAPRVVVVAARQNSPVNVLITEAELPAVAALADALDQ